MALFVYWFTHLFFYDFCFFFNSFSIRPRQHQRIVKCSSCYIHSTVTHPANAHVRRLLVRFGISIVPVNCTTVATHLYTCIWLDIRWQCDTDVAFLLPLCRHDVTNKKLSCRWQTAQRTCANAMAWLTSKKHAPPRMCYHVEFGRSALKVVVGKKPKIQQNLKIS